MSRGARGSRIEHKRSRATHFFFFLLELMSTMPSPASAVTQVVDLITKLGVVAGGLFAGWQYWEAKVDRRIERTTHYLERYEDGSVAQARERIESGLRPYLQQFDELSTGGLSQRDRERVVLAIVDESPEIPAAIDDVADFFNGLETCVSSRLCDRNTAERYFRDTDIGIWENFEPYIALRRRNNPEYGKALEHYSTRRPDVAV